MAADARGQGLDSELLAFGEQRIFRDFKNVFLCVRKTREPLTAETRPPSLRVS